MEEFDGVGTGFQLYHGFTPLTVTAEDESGDETKGPVIQVDG